MPIMSPVPMLTKDKGVIGAIWMWIVTTRKWKIEEDWTYEMEGTKYRIPKGFIFDGASVPKYFRSWLSPMGVLLIAGLIHDYAYRVEGLLLDTSVKVPLTQLEADTIFREVAIAVNGFKIINYIAYYALRLGGWIAWRKHRNMNIISNKILVLITGLVLLIGSFFFARPAQALDDFNLMKYGPDDTVEVVRDSFIVKFIWYTFQDNLNEAWDNSKGDNNLPEGAGVRGFAVVNETQDVCFVHLIAAKIWDDREAMAIMGHEVYHCALAEHKDPEAIEEPKTNKSSDIEDLYAQDRKLELEWLRDDYADMGIQVDET